MKNRWNLRLAFFALFSLLALAVGLSAQVPSPYPSALSSSGYPVTHRVLPNGLEVFAVENHSLPLVTICLVFRGGASAQTKETAGLFRLYERMLFAGNPSYPTKESLNASLNTMGATTWNGSAGTEYSHYYITIPSDKTEEGLAFWAAVVTSPSLDPSVLENEKQSLLNEMAGNQADPARIAASALESRMFPEYPWRKNVDGPATIIAGATIEQLRTVQATYYIPSNCALMVAGDIDPDRVFGQALDYFGAWRGALPPSIGEPPHGPIPADVRVLATDDLFYRGVAYLQYRWRGPDVLRQTADTYVSDVLLFLLSSPSGRFKNSLMKRVPSLFDPEYTDFIYPTARDGGNFIFSAYLAVQKPATEEAILDRVEGLRRVVADEFAIISADPEAYFGSAELEKAKATLIDQNTFAMESAENFVADTLSFWWSIATADYFFSYESQCRKVSWADISDLLIRYIVGSSPSAAPPCATLVRLRTSTAAADPRMAAKMVEYGYFEAAADNSFWWQR
ncbi:MAG TPA: pitrilysin family protein [Rectinemataceae bacterium]